MRHAHMKKNNRGDGEDSIEACRGREAAKNTIGLPTTFAIHGCGRVSPGVLVKITVVVIALLLQLPLVSENCQCSNRAFRT